MRSYTYCTSFSDILYLWFSSFKFSNVFLPAETVILGCSWVAFWPVMTCKMMYQIGYSFYWSIKRWSKLGPKYFWLILRVFLFMPSCTLWVISPKVLPNERAGEISVASSISIEFLVMKLKIFTVFCIDSTCNEMVPFWFFWALAPPDIVQSCWNFDQRYSLIRQTECLKNPSKFRILASWKAPKVYIFVPFWGPMYRWKTKNIAKNQNFYENYILRNIEQRKSQVS